MIVTFTANPSIDRTAPLDQPVTRGGVHRLGAVTAEPGGKGVNVARAVHLAGAPTVAVLPADDHDPILAGLDALGVRHATVPTGAPVRSNLTLTEPDGTTTKLNEPGARLDEEKLVALENILVAAAKQAKWIALSGSLPPGAPVDWYAGLVQRLRPLGARIAVDTSDAPLKALAEAMTRRPGCAPHLVKPNSEELGQLCGVDGLALEAQAEAGDFSGIESAARQLVARGVDQVLVTLGGAGAMLVTEQGSWRAVHEPITVASTVGAGDSSLAGFLLAATQGLAPDECLRRAVAYGSAAAGLPGSQLPRPNQADEAKVTVTAL